MIILGQGFNVDNAIYVDIDGTAGGAAIGGEGSAKVDAFNRLNISLRAVDTTGEDDGGF